MTGRHLDEQGLDAGCRQARRRLLEGLPAPDHLEDCGACRAFEARLELVDRLLSTAPGPTASQPPHLVVGTLRRLAERQARRQRRRVIGLAALAATLLGVSVWSGFRLLSGVTAASWTLQSTFAQTARDSMTGSLSWLSRVAGDAPAGLEGVLAGWSVTLPTGASLTLALAALVAIAGSWMIHVSVTEG